MPFVRLSSHAAKDMLDISSLSDQKAIYNKLKKAKIGRVNMRECGEDALCTHYFRVNGYVFICDITDEIDDGEPQYEINRIKRWSEFEHLLIR